MAFWFTHALVAFKALQKLKGKEFSSFEQIDDYLFGSVAPDIRYLTKVDRRVTHEPFGKKSAFEAFKGKDCSEAFIAGYESHLVCDEVWSGEHGGLDISIYDFFKADPGNVVAKFSLYFFVDDYFQGQSNWLFPLIFSGNVFRANETKALRLL
ncbi:zinc dependent phospholipase C family protein, partial [Candidatus Micrarchaeota archaeon]|nr:zinc dependent phospholipase C family protein [Candidatus Micrarchaeota archaeon]MBU1939663.1 zinc dependent phospholipase C family protein [Candidatus Micrarchaeota archaeon]